MRFLLRPWQLLGVIFAGLANEQQQQVIAYLRTENEVLKEKLGKKRILLNDDQRCRLAVKGKVLGRKILEEICTIFTPDTILRWHRELIARKWDHSAKRNIEPDRPISSIRLSDKTSSLRPQPALCWHFQLFQAQLLVQVFVGITRVDPYPHLMLLT